MAKFPSNRLKNVMGELISNMCNTFILGRKILDSIFIANERLDSRWRKGIPEVLCKLDLEKAYDPLNWDFFFIGKSRGSEFILAFWLFSFEYWCGFFCCNYYVFVKETHSPLFVSVMEVLSRMISKVVDGGFLLRFL